MRFSYMSDISFTGFEAEEVNEVLQVVSNFPFG